MTTGNERSADGLTAWLQTLQASDCAEVLIGADVDMDVVRDLTDNDLRELGLSLGQRKRLIRGITELNQQDRADTDPERTRAEHRQLSVLFCDLVGSTNLSTKLDAEEFATILQDYHGLCASVATQWGGRLVSQFGDGCMVIFGHPRMHEDDAERAIRAGHQMLREIEQTGPFEGDYLQARIAVATGRVVIGDLTGASDQDSLAGETPNLAARLQGTVEPRQLVIDERTMRLVSHAFDLTPTGPQDLRGFDKPVEGWIVGPARERRNRYDMLAPVSLHDTFGREPEIALLQECWKEAQAGQSRMVVLRGEPGIGKSWLISTFASKALEATPELRRLRLFCSAYHQNTALHPALDQLLWTAGIRASDGANAIRVRLSSYFDGLPGNFEGAVDLIAASIMGRAPDGATLDLNAGQQKAAMFRLLSDLVELQAAQGPVLLEFEDAHWADPSSLELLAQLAGVHDEEPPQRQMMIVVTHRPDFQTDWPDRPWITTRTLERMSPSDCIDLARSAAKTALPEARLREIATKADGVPLFVREIARALAEAENDDVGGTVEVPDTLEGSLVARLDRLGPTKRIAQIAAVLGRLFHDTSLAEISGEDLSDVQAALAELVDAEVITPLPDVGPGAYLFRHALIQDAAYGSLLRRERREIHQRAARVLEADRAAAQVAPEILARHYSGAEMPIEAVGKLIEAGRNATSRAAQIEANNHFRTALRHLEGAPKDRSSKTLEATVHALLGQSLIATMGFGAPEIADSFANARALSEETGDAALMVASVYGMWAVAAARGDRDRTMALADEAVGLFGDSEVPIFALAANFMAGVTRLYDGRLEEAQSALDRAVALYDPTMYPHMMQAFGDDLGTFALIYLQWIASLRGDFAGAAELTQRITQISETLGDKQIDTRNIGFATGGAQMVGATDMALGMADRLIEVATELCYPHWIATARINRGWALCQHGEGDAGIAEIEAGLAFFNMIGQRTPLSLCHGVQVEAYLALERHSDAERAATEALEICDTSLDRLYSIDLRRQRAEARMPGDPVAAEAELHAVLTEAESAGMHYFALRTATALARLVGDAPGGDRIRADLARIRARITQPMPLPTVMAADSLLPAKAS